MWLRRMIAGHFDKLLLVVLIGASIALACIGDILVLRSLRGMNLVSREWLREQTALLIGALLGLMRGQQQNEGGADDDERG